MPQAADKKRSGPSPAFTKLKTDAAEFKKKTNAKIREMREERAPNAMLNVTGTFLGAVPTGIVCGAVPDSWEMGEAKTEIPSGAIVEVGAVLLGGGVMTAAYFMKSEYFVHTGGGMAATGTAFLAARGTRWLREKAMDYWYEGTAEGTAEERAAA